MSLLSMLPQVDEAYYAEDLYQMFLSHFPYIRTNELFDTHSVSGVVAEIHRHNFHGLLGTFDIPREFHRVVTAFNGYLSSIDYPGDREGFIVVPKMSTLTDLAAVHFTRTI